MVDHMDGWWLGLSDYIIIYATMSTEHTTPYTFSQAIVSACPEQYAIFSF